MKLPEIEARHEWWAIRLREWVEHGRDYTKGDVADALYECFRYIAEAEVELSEWESVDWLEPPALMRMVPRAEVVAVSPVYL